jgi:FtsH-binding integral membrane protein
LNSIDSVNARSVEYQRAIGAHTHAIYLGLVIIVLGLVLNFALGNSRYKSHIAISLGAGAVIYPLGLALQASGNIRAGEGLALLGSVAVIGCMGVIVLKLLGKNRADE